MRNPSEPLEAVFMNNSFWKLPEQFTVDEILKQQENEEKKE
jgi:hypothetical protein